MSLLMSEVGDPRGSEVRFSRIAGCRPVDTDRPGDAVLCRPGTGVDRCRRARRGDPAPLRSLASLRSAPGRAGRRDQRDLLIGELIEFLQRHL